MTARGEAWGRPASSPPDLRVRGSDADLARAAAGHEGALVDFEPDSTSDLARAVGLRPHTPRRTEVPIDGLRSDDGVLAVNMVILGPAPDRLARRHRSCSLSVVLDDRSLFDGRATTVVIASGEFLRGSDVVPRGHPGDGRLEVHVYSVAPRERAELRRRLPTGTHVPHPAVRTGTGRRVVVESARRLVTEVDGVPGGSVDRLVVDLVPAVVRLLV